MCGCTYWAIKYATLETIRALGAFFAAISALYLADFTFFNGQHIDQAVQIKTGWKIFQIATFRYSANSLTLRTSDCVSAMACSVPLFQALQAETVKTWQLFWIRVYVSAHWTRHFFTKIMKQRFDIHVVFTSQRTEQRFRRNQLETMKPCDDLFLAILRISACYDINLFRCTNQSGNRC